jgi:glycosyltransferase involved in cell wall biosynthesis
LFLDGLTEPYRAQAIDLIRRQVDEVERFIAVSEAYRQPMAELLCIPPGRIAVVPLGITLDGYDRRGESDGTFRVGYFARLAPEKGLHVLADAYRQFRRTIGAAPVRLEAAGYLSRAHAPYLDEVRERLGRAGLGGEFTYHGTVDRAGKLAFLRTLDVLSVPTTYDEPKGVFVLEAMASGVPVVQPRRGAFTEVVEKTGGGLLVPPDDVDALAGGLVTLWRDRDLARRLGERAFHGVREHYNVGRSADRLLKVYEDAISGVVSERPVRAAGVRS